MSWLSPLLPFSALLMLMYNIANLAHMHISEQLVLRKHGLIRKLSNRTINNIILLKHLLLSISHHSVQYLLVCWKQKMYDKYTRMDVAMAWSVLHKVAIDVFCFQLLAISQIQCIQTIVLIDAPFAAALLSHYCDPVIRILSVTLSG